MVSAYISQPYPDVKLDFDLRQIRLAAILPGRYADTITCELSTASIDNLPEYYALSYAWGDRKCPRQIFVNGDSFNITPNLEASLRRLRHQSESRLFWIDMICIDQDSDEEKTNQVNLMALIYSGAQEVLLWLGDFVETPVEKSTLTSEANEDQEVSKPYSSKYHISNTGILNQIKRHNLTRLILVSRSNRGHTCP